MASSAERKSKALASAKEESIVDPDALPQTHASSKIDIVEGDALMQVDGNEVRAIAELPWT